MKTLIEKQGVLVINKPIGKTSHDVVAMVRRILGQRRVGHAGTLDPLATGVLVVLAGKSTKMFDKFVAYDKGYRATLKLGLKTSSADIMGETLEEKPYVGITADDVTKAFAKFTGEIEQLPPMVSAVRHKGERLYKIARTGQQVERTPRKVRIDQLTILRFAPPEVEFFMACSKGTYVRQLADDVGDLLGCGACICQIERTKVGPFDIAQAKNIEDVNESHLLNFKD